MEFGNETIQRRPESEVLDALTRGCDGINIAGQAFHPDLVIDKRENEKIIRGGEVVLRGSLTLAEVQYPVDVIVELPGRLSHVFSRLRHQEPTARLNITIG